MRRSTHDTVYPENLASPRLHHIIITIAFMGISVTNREETYSFLSGITVCRASVLTHRHSRRCVADPLMVKNTMIRSKVG